MAITTFKKEQTAAAMTQTKCNLAVRQNGSTVWSLAGFDSNRRDIVLRLNVHHGPHTRDKTAAISDD
jgi:hypothetical protein